MPSIARPTARPEGRSRLLALTAFPLALILAVVLIPEPAPEARVDPPDVRGAA
jgi:hypothetical protein